MAYDVKAMTKGIMNGYIEKTLSLEDMLYVKGKTAIVTGGTSGLGFCVAQRLCQGGAKVVIAGSTQEKGDTAVELLREKGYEVSFCRTDVRSESEVEHLVNYTAETYGSVDILVTSGGVWSFGHVYDMPEEEFQRIIDINLTGAFRCAKHVSRYMIAHQIKGKMVLVSSNSAYLSQPLFGGYCHYTASKGGVIAMTQELGKELKRFGIMVNSVAPGAMMTPGCLTNGVVRGLSPEQQAEMGAELHAATVAEVPSADSVAIVVYGFCTGMADGVTGECIVADNGMMRNIVSFQPACAEYPPKQNETDNEK